MEKRLLMMVRLPLFLLISFIWPILHAARAQNIAAPNFSSEATSQGATFELPSAPQKREQIDRAANWLQKQIYQGSLNSTEETRGAKNIAVIAWHDPTLTPGKPDSMVGYLTTDTLWAGHALKLTHPHPAKQLLRSLKSLRAERNGLHEVLFAPLKEIRHQPIDADPVHGKSIGRITLGEDKSIDVRQFHLQANREFAVVHPRLFAEVTAYQAMFEFWQGDTKAAQRRLAQIFRPTNEASKSQPVIWDNQRQLLIDSGNYQQWKKDSRCHQFPIKLGTVLYALRLTGLDQEFPEQTVTIETRLWQAQHPTATTDQSNDKSAGSVAHFFVVEKEGGVRRAPGATGEATAIAILASTVQKAKPRE